MDQPDVSPLQVSSPLRKYLPKGPSCKTVQRCEQDPCLLSPQTALTALEPGHQPQKGLLSLQEGTALRMELTEVTGDRCLGSRSERLACLPTPSP